MFAHIVLGVVQGLTEFLPISSSGHLVLVQRLLGFSQVDPAFDVFVQGGTVLSVLIFFRHRLRQLTWPYAKYLLLGAVPAGIIGVLLSDWIDSLFSSLWGITIGFALTTTIVYLSRLARPRGQAITPRSALLIGLAQACAILPGLSRSGSTITTSLLLGIAPLAAFDYSFLLSIPVIAGASLLSLRSLTLSSALLPSYLVGFFVATVTGYFSLILLAKMVRKGQFYLFAPYTAFLTLISLYLALTS